jgi:hypothetical protein
LRIQRDVQVPSLLTNSSTVSADAVFGRQSVAQEVGAVCAKPLSFQQVEQAHHPHWLVVVDGLLAGLEADVLQSALSPLADSDWQMSQLTVEGLESSALQSCPSLKSIGWQPSDTFSPSEVVSIFLYRLIVCSFNCSFLFIYSSLTISCALTVP